MNHCTYIITRDVDREECPWLEKDLLKGESLYQYHDRKPPSDDFLYCRYFLVGEPFKVPENALIDENWLKDRPAFDAKGIPILYLDERFLRMKLDGKK